MLSACEAVLMAVCSEKACLWHDLRRLAARSRPRRKGSAHLQPFGDEADMQSAATVRLVDIATKTIGSLLGAEDVDAATKIVEAAATVSVFVTR